MEHNKQTGMIVFNEQELAVMPNMPNEISEHEVPIVQDIVFKLGNQCIKDLIGRGSASPMFSDKSKAAFLRDRLATLSTIHDDLDQLIPKGQLTLPTKEN
jgi:hypothetical protein